MFLLKVIPHIFLPENHSTYSSPKVSYSSTVKSIDIAFEGTATVLFYPVRGSGGGGVNNPEFRFLQCVISTDVWLIVGSNFQANSD